MPTDGSTLACPSPPAMLNLLVALAQLNIAVPRVPAPTMDGRLTSGEWTPTTQAFAGGAVRVQRSEETVFIALEGNGDGIAHLCVSRGDTVDVLHASASLGRARYVSSGGRWSLQSGFTWAVRDSRDGPDSPAARADYLRAEGWTGSTVAQSPRIHEFAIDARWFGPETRLAAALLQPTQGAITAWPGGAAGGCQDLALAMGSPPAGLAFTPATWARLDVAAGARP